MRTRVVVRYRIQIQKRGCLRFRQTPLLDYVRFTPCAMLAVPSKAQAADVQTGGRRILIKVEVYIDFNHGTVVTLLLFVPYDVRGAVPFLVEFEIVGPILGDVKACVAQLDLVKVLVKRAAPVVGDAHVDLEMGEVVYADRQVVVGLLLRDRMRLHEPSALPKGERADKPRPEYCLDGIGYTGCDINCLRNPRGIYELGSGGGVEGEAVLSWTCFYWCI